MKIELRPLDTKQHVLDEAGLAYNFDRRVYFNRKSKKIFILAFLEDKSDKEIKCRRSLPQPGLLKNVQLKPGMRFSFIAESCLASPGFPPQYS